MKLSKVPAILFGAALLFSSSAFAGEINKAALHLGDRVTVHGKSLKPGDYTVEWNGSGPDVQVTILQRKQVVATLSGRLTDQAASLGSETAYGTREGSDGSRSLTVIYPGRKKVALEFEDDPRLVDLEKKKQRLSPELD